MSRPGARYFWLALFLLLLLASCMRGETWQIAKEPSCDPASSPLLSGAQAWRESFAQGQARGCLQVTWGDRADEGKTVWVSISASGDVKAYNEASGAFDAPVSVSLPLSAGQMVRRFRLYAFGRKLMAGDASKDTCLRDMARRSYTCDFKEDGDCWFGWAFAPSASSNTDTFPVLPTPGGSSCELLLGPQTSKETTTEPNADEPASDSPDLREPNAELDAGLRDLPVDKAPEPLVDVVPDTAVEVPSEPQIELQPEPQPEPQLEQGNQCTTPLVWGRHIGGTGLDVGARVAIDPTGGLFAVGFYYKSAIFGATNLSSINTAYYLTKINAAGQMQWAVSTGNSHSNAGDVAVDSRGNAVVVGRFQLTASFGSDARKSAGRFDLFVAKVDRTGKYVWSLATGGPEDDAAAGVALDKQGNAYVVGSFQGNVPFGQPMLRATRLAAYVTKVGPKGSFLLSSQILSNGVDGSNFAEDVALDASGNIYVVGGHYGKVSYKGASLPNKGGSDIFVAKFSSTFQPEWLVTAGSSKADFVKGVAVDANGDVWITGSTYTGFTIDRRTLQSTSTKQFPFVAKLSPAGKSYWIVGAISPSSSGSNDIALDAKGNAYVTGKFIGKITLGPLPALLGMGKDDTFLAKLDTNGKYTWRTAYSTTSINIGFGIAVEPNGLLYVTGRTAGKHASPQVDAPKGADDGFVAKFCVP